MPWLRFLTFNALGALLWVGTWTALGDLAGAHIGEIYGTLRRYELLLLAGLVIVVAGLVVRHRHRRDQAEPTARAHRVEGRSARVPPRPGVVAVAIVGAAVAFVVLWLGVATTTLLALLDPVADGWVVAVRSAAVVGAARVVSDVGQPAVMIGLLVVVTAVVAACRRSWTPVGITVGALVLLGLLDNGVKALVVRPRPPVVWHAVPAHGLSFPSGHALWSAGVLLLVVVLVGPCRGRRVLVGVAILLAVLVGSSRVVLGVHYPSDVLAGWSLALVADGLVLLLAGRLVSSRVPIDQPVDGD